MKKIFYLLFLTLGLLSSSYGATKSPNKKTIDPIVVFADPLFKQLLLSASSTNDIAISNTINSAYVILMSIVMERLKKVKQTQL